MDKGKREVLIVFSVSYYFFLFLISSHVLLSFILYDIAQAREEVRSKIVSQVHVSHSCSLRRTLFFNNFLTS